MSKPNDDLIDKLERVFDNPNNRGFYALCTMHIPFDELCRLVGYSIMYGLEPAKFFTVGAKKYFPHKSTPTTRNIMEESEVKKG